MGIGLRKTAGGGARLCGVSFPRHKVTVYNDRKEEEQCVHVNGQPLAEAVR